MRMFTTVAVVAVVAACAMAMSPQKTRPMAAKEARTDAASTYEHLATALIALRETENSLVRGMLADYAADAHAHLAHAGDATGRERAQMLEAAAAAVTNLAGEGDKRIQAIRQRLLKAGHHHHTDQETQADYMFIDSTEKAALLTFAGQLARMNRASSDELEAASSRLDRLVSDAMKAE